MKQPVHFFGCDADPGVLDLEANHNFLVIVLFHHRTQCDRASLGELHCIGGVIEQRLAQPRQVTTQPKGSVCAIDLHPQSLVQGGLADDGRYMVKNGTELEVVAFELQPVRLDFGQVKNVIDDRQQVAPCAVDLVQTDRLFRRRPPAAQQVVQANDGVHGGAYLMAHVGQEGAFGQIGRVGLLAGQRQLGGAAHHKVFKVEAVVVQFVAEAFFLGDVLFDRDIVADRAVGLAQRADDRELNVFAAVLAPVGEFTFPG